MLEGHWGVLIEEGVVGGWDRKSGWSKTLWTKAQRLDCSRQSQGRANMRSGCVWGCLYRMFQRVLGAQNREGACHVRPRSHDCCKQCESQQTRRAEVPQLPRGRYLIIERRIGKWRPRTTIQGKRRRWWLRPQGKEKGKSQQQELR